jgi:hypothetical protein
MPWERVPPARTGIAPSLGARASGAHGHCRLAPTPDSEINPASVFPLPAGAGEGGGESVCPGSARLRRANRPHEPIPEFEQALT